MADTRKIRLILELRGAGIADSRILAAIERVPREAFVPATFRDQAYANTALPIGHGATISEPRVVATMTQALELGTRMKVLEVGTGSGYQAAVLSHLCLRVYTIERNRELLREAMERFTALRMHNITTRPGDGMRGWPEQAPFERIIVTAAGLTAPKDLLDQLAVGGIMVLPLGPDGRTQTLYRLRRTETGIEEQNMGPVRFVPLRGGLEEAASSA